MSNPLKQSIKARLRIVAKVRNLTLDEIWHNLILERFLARLCRSKYKTNFILKGGSLLARYISIGRETKDLDFLVEKLKNTEEFLGKAFDHICSVHLEDGFEFEKVSIGKLMHPHMDYTGIEVLLLAKLGGPQTHIQIDLGFGDIVEAIDYPMDLTSTSKGPLFESKIQVRSYPKEFIFAEKLETVIYRDSGNTRMKDFHDLYSLISLEKCLDPAYTDKVVKNVFNHRETSLKKLPITFEADSMETLQPLWHGYQKDLLSTKTARQPPKLLQELISAVNDWLTHNTRLCTSVVTSSNESSLEEQDGISYVKISLGKLVAELKGTPLLENVKTSLASGADVNDDSRNGHRPLQMALKKGDAEVSRLLIKHGADLNYRDQSGSTPLEAAVNHGHIQLAKLLIQKGAHFNPNAPNLGFHYPNLYQLLIGH